LHSTQGPGIDSIIQACLYLDYDTGVIRIVIYDTGVITKSLFKGILVGSQK